MYLFNDSSVSKSYFSLGLVLEILLPCARLSEGGRETAYIPTDRQENVEEKIHATKAR